MKNNVSTKELVQMSLLAAIMAVLTLTPLGFIPLSPALRPTTVHIPVIIGAIIIGPKAGAVLGAFFGLISLLTNTFQPTAASFCFSPFYNLGEYGGSLTSLVVCFVPRILVGVSAGYVFKGMRKLMKNNSVPAIFAAVCGSLTNTVLVMCGIYIFFAEGYAAIKGQTVATLFKFLMGVVATNGVPEAIVAAVITVAIVTPLMRKK